MPNSAQSASLGDLELFVAVARARSFTRAAAALGMPPSTLSRRIAEMEASLGLPLFLRSTRRVELTEEARRYLARCEAIVAAAREAEAELRGLKETPSGLLRISMDADLGPSLIAPVAASFLAQHPQVTLDLDLSPRRVDLIAEGFDIAIRLGTLPDSTLTVRHLATLRVGLFAAPDYLRTHGLPNSPADLACHARVHLLHQDDPGDWHLHDATGRVVIARAGCLVAANAMSMVRTLARLGVGIAVLDEVLGTEEVRAGSLLRVLPEWHLPEVAVSILTPSRLLPARARLFIDHLIARAALLPGVAGAPAANPAAPPAAAGPGAA